MAVKIRLSRTGRKNRPYYRVVVADGRMPRDGRFIELLGHYDPKVEPSLIKIDKEKTSQWLAKGAQPTGAVTHLLEIVGILEKPVKKVPKKKAPAKEKGEKKAPKAKEASKKKETPKEKGATKKKAALKKGGGEGGEGVTSDTSSSDSG